MGEYLDRSELTFLPQEYFTDNKTGEEGRSMLWFVGNLKVMKLWYEAQYEIDSRSCLIQAMVRKDKISDGSPDDRA